MCFLFYRIYRRVAQIGLVRNKSSKIIFYVSIEIFAIQGGCRL